MLFPLALSYATRSQIGVPHAIAISHQALAFFCHLPAHVRTSSYNTPASTANMGRSRRHRSGFCETPTNEGTTPERQLSKQQTTEAHIPSPQLPHKQNVSQEVHATAETPESGIQSQAGPPKRSLPSTGAEDGDSSKVFVKRHCTLVSQVESASYM
jgi:hypothetical protein